MALAGCLTAAASNHPTAILKAVIPISRSKLSPVAFRTAEPYVDSDHRHTHQSVHNGTLLDDDSCFEDQLLLDGMQAYLHM